MAEQTPEFIIAALIEANEDLQHEANRLRVNNKIARTIIRVLREQATALRNQLQVAAENDQNFKDFCEGKFDAPGKFDVPVSVEADGALPEAESVVEHSV